MKDVVYVEVGSKNDVYQHIDLEHVMGLKVRCTQPVVSISQKNK